MIESRPVAPARSRSWSNTDLQILLAVLIWGVNFAVVKFALGEFLPLAFNAVRFSIATIAMLLVLRWRRESYAIERRDLFPMIFLGVVGHTIYQLFFINGVARTVPANASLLMATSPIFVVIYGRLLGIERTNRTVWAGILLSFAGIVLLILGGTGGLHLGASTIVGDLLILCASMLWAVYTTGSKPLLTRYSPVKLTGMTMLFGTLPLLVISIPSVRQQDWASATPAAWAGLLYSAVFSVALAYVFWYNSVRRVGNARTAVFSNLTPVVAAITAWIALGYRIYPLQLVGATVVLAGVMLTRRGRS